MPPRLGTARDLGKHLHDLASGNRGCAVSELGALEQRRSCWVKRRIRAVVAKGNELVEQRPAVMTQVPAGLHTSPANIYGAGGRRRHAVPESNSARHALGQLPGNRVAAGGRRLGAADRLACGGPFVGAAARLTVARQRGRRMSAGITRRSHRVRGHPVRWPPTHGGPAPARGTSEPTPSAP
jgi:hypothetical protein